MTITVSGYAGEGKTAIIVAVDKALRDAGLETVIVDRSEINIAHESGRALISISENQDEPIRIVEEQVRR